MFSFFKKAVRPAGRPIGISEIDHYLKTEYPGCNMLNVREELLEGFTPLRQDVYHDKLNCSITSMTACIHYLCGGKYSPDEIYPYVKKIAKIFLYNGFWGTFSFVIWPVYAIALRHFGVKRHTGTGVLKHLGYNRNRIISRINSGTPVILNMFRDGRRCYKNHTVTVIGYRMYESDNKKKLFLILNDNWSGEKRFLDYDKLWIISSVNF